MVRAVKTLFFATLRGASLLSTAVVLVGAAACGSSSPATADKAASDGGSAESSVLPPPSPPADLDTTPIDTTSLTAMTWSWLPIQGAICRDGSATGIGLNLNPASPNLMIYLEGGGACFNSTTCEDGNPSCFSPPGATGCLLEFDTRLMGASGSDGLFNRTDAANPVKDWNFVYVPYCTGDIHAGNKPNATIPDDPSAGPQQFVGYVNMARYLARLAPTFKTASKVLLTGISAGGFGAAANYPQTARAFAPIPVYDLDDSGPPMEDPYVPKCLQQGWAQVWGFDKTVLADCGADCPDPTNYTLDAVIHTAKAYPKIPFGLLDDTDDSVITLFYGFGANNCASTIIPTPLTQATFTAGLLDERTKLQAAGVTNSGSFIFQGTAHTSLGASSTYDAVTTGGDETGPTINLSAWVTTLVNSGTVTNEGP
jgi:hypothetical protein